MTGCKYHLVSDTASLISSLSNVFVFWFLFWFCYGCLHFIIGMQSSWKLNNQLSHIDRGRFGIAILGAYGKDGNSLSSGGRLNLQR